MEKIKRIRNNLALLIMFIVFVAASMFGITFCGIHSFVSMANRNIVLFANLQKGLTSAFMLEIILTFAMLAILGFSFVLFLNKKISKKVS